MKHIRQVKIEKKIARLIEQLPDEKYACLAKTDSQMRYLASCRKENKLVSIAWLARITGANDPLQELLDKGEIKETTHLYIYRLVRFFQSLWAVIQIGWKHIKKVLGSECPFGDASELFEAILRDWFNNNFATCLAPHWGLNVSDEKKSCEAVRTYADNLINRTQIQQKTISEINSLSVIPSQFEAYWFISSLSICFQEAAYNPTLYDELENFFKDISGFAAFGEQWASRKRPSKTYPKLSTVQVVEGQVYRNSKLS